MTHAHVNERLLERHTGAGRNGLELSGGATCAQESRARLLELSVGLVEDLRRRGTRPGKGPEAFSEHFQICLPYRGVFVWHVGGEDVVGDSNQVVFVRGGEEFRMSSPLPEGYAELIITPDVELLSELAHLNGRPLSEHPLFLRRSWCAEPRFLSFRARFLQWARTASVTDGLEGEEALLALMRSALQQNGARQKPDSASTARLIRRAKEFLEANLSKRILLADVARAAGASPAYLTDLFRRVEGVSLHQYLNQLRLARALDELLDAADLTALALDLGFSSHSHFSYVFRRTFGCTPSQFRNAAVRAVPPPPCQRLVSRARSVRPMGSVSPHALSGNKLTRDAGGQQESPMISAHPVE